MQLDKGKIREYAKNALNAWNEQFNAEDEAIRDAILCLALEKLGVDWVQLLDDNKVSSVDLCDMCEGLIGFVCTCDEKLFSGV